MRTPNEFYLLVSDEGSDSVITGKPLAKKSMIVAKISGFKIRHSTSSSNCHTKHGNNMTQI
jgi:hypothetical protein